VETDGHFRFPDFYYRTVDFITNGADAGWVKELLGHYNKWVAVLQLERPCTTNPFFEGSCLIICVVLDMMQR
jgi:hypothetical protein